MEPKSIEIEPASLKRKGSSHYTVSEAGAAGSKKKVRGTIDVRPTAETRTIKAEPASTEERILGNSESDVPANWLFRLPAEIRLQIFDELIFSSFWARSPGPFTDHPKRYIVPSLWPNRAQRSWDRCAVIENHIRNLLDAYPSHALAAEILDALKENERFVMEHLERANKRLKRFRDRRKAEMTRLHQDGVDIYNGQELKLVCHYLLVEFQFYREVQDDRLGSHGFQTLKRLMWKDMGLNEDEVGNVESLRKESQRLLKQEHNKFEFICDLRSFLVGLKGKEPPLIFSKR